MSGYADHIGKLLLGVEYVGSRVWAYLPPDTDREAVRAALEADIRTAIRKHLGPEAALDLDREFALTVCPGSGLVVPCEGGGRIDNGLPSVQDLVGIAKDAEPAPLCAGCGEQLETRDWWCGYYETDRHGAHWHTECTTLPNPKFRPAGESR